MTTPTEPRGFHLWRAPSRLFAVALAAVLMGGCDSGAADQAAAAPATDAESVAVSPDAQRDARIETSVVEADDSQGRLQVPALLQVDESATARLGSIIDAVVTDLTAVVGARVERGAELGTLHSHLLHEALGDYRKALAEVRRREMELTYASHAEARAERLLAAKAVSQGEVERARTDRVAAEEELTIARSEVQRALDELEHLGIDEPDADGHATERIPIRSPLTGVVLERLVTPGTAVTPGTPLFVISDLSRLWAVAEVDQVHLPRLASGMTATVRVAAYPDAVFPARVLAVGDAINETTRRVQVRLSVTNTDGRLKPHMYGTVDLTVDDRPAAVTVPASALQSVGDESVVFVQDDDGRFRQRVVTLVEERDGHARIAAGLAAGERVVTNGSFLLKSALAPPPAD